MKGDCLLHRIGPELHDSLILNQRGYDIHWLGFSVCTLSGCPSGLNGKLT